jgi:DNA-binding CsgD family transcriptional regulator
MGQGSNRLDRMLDLIGQVYDAALDERLWSALAPKIAGAFDATSTAVFLRETQHGAVDLLSLTANFDPAALHAYASYYAERDVWFARAVEISLSKVFTGNDLIEDGEFERTEIYNDYCRPNGGFFYMVGSVFPIGNNELAAIGVHRPRASGPFEEANKALVGTFLPHLQRALQVRRQLSEPGIVAGAALDVLDRSGTATLVVARDGRIFYTNREAENLLRTRSGVTTTNGRLATGHRAVTDRLTALIRSAVDTATGCPGSPGGVLAIERDDRLPLTILVAPFRTARNGFGAPVPAAIVFVRDPERPTPMRLALQSLFGLTIAEACIASMLAEGKSLADVATRQGIALNTIRVHLKNIFAKTGTARQGQLVALILRSVAGMVSTE